MNSKQAKRIKITDVLESQGFQVVGQHCGGHELVYENPLRNEKNASFFVNPRKNVFNDFGGEGGTVIDLVCQMQNTDVRGALQWLSSFSGTSYQKISLN